jgi:cytoskeletal protein RodZ
MITIIIRTCRKIFSIGPNHAYSFCEYPKIGGVKFMELKDQQMNLTFVIFAGLLISFLLTLKRQQESGQSSFFQTRYEVSSIQKILPHDSAPSASSTADSSPSKNMDHSLSH